MLHVEGVMYFILLSGAIICLIDAFCHPAYYCGLIIFYCIISCFYLSMICGSRILSFMVFLLFVGGLMIVFLFFSSLFAFYPQVSLFLCLISVLGLSLISVGFKMTPESFVSSSGVIVIFSSSWFFLVLLMILYLVIVLVFIVYYLSCFDRPMRCSYSF